MSEFLDRWVYFENRVETIELDPEGNEVTIVTYPPPENGMLYTDQGIGLLPRRWKSKEGVRYTDFNEICKDEVLMNELGWYKAMEEILPNTLLPNSEDYTDTTLVSVRFIQTITATFVEREVETIDMEGNVTTETVTDTIINVNKVFNALFEKSYKELTKVINIKVSKLREVKHNFIKTSIEEDDEIERWQTSYKVIGLLIKAFSKNDPIDYVNNNVTLQDMLVDINIRNTNITAIRKKIKDVKAGTDIETIINL